jgi:hypothetical protein
MAQTQIASGAGLRNIRAWLMDASGYPDGDQSGLNGYDGFLIDGAKSFSTTVPDSQTVTHRGNDQPFAQDVLPPTELESATLTSGKTNLSADAALSATKVESIAADLVMGGMSTNKQGCEPQIILWGWRQALDTDPDSATFGNRRYITHLYPSTRVVPKAGSMDEGSDDVNTYNVVPTVVTRKPWGVAFTELVNGYTRSQRLRLISDNPLMMESYVTSGAAATFNLNFAPISAAKTHVWFYGTPQVVNSVDVNAKTFTLSGAPALSTDPRLVVLYETTEVCGQ